MADLALRPFVRPLFALAGAVALALLLPPPAPAATEYENTRIVVNGFVDADEYAPDESLFQLTPDLVPEESSVDSKWGRYDDLNNIRLSWDKDSLYVAVEGFIFDNNMMIFFDTLPLPDGQNPGLSSLSQANSWKRQVTFDNGFFPDLFLATWDNNTKPQAWQYQAPNVVAQVAEASFLSVASFSRDVPGRALEAAIPWDIVFLGRTHREFRAEYGDTVTTLPLGVDRLRIAGWITTGSDGLGGPDSAPDNLSGHQVDSGTPVVLDNYIIVTLDRTNAAGDPASPDGVPDFGVRVRTPTESLCTFEVCHCDTEECVPAEAYNDYVHTFFFFPPPVHGQTLEIDRLEFLNADGTPGPRAIAPELGDITYFQFTVTPVVTDTLLLEARQVDFTAEVYDLNGDRVRTIYKSQPFDLGDLYPVTGSLPPGLLERNRFDGRDDRGHPLDAGIYLLRVVLEPGADDAKRAVVVVR